MVAVAYVLRLEDLAHDVHALTTGAVVARAMGADVEVPQWEDARASFDAALAAAPPQVRTVEREAGGPDDMRAIKLRALSLPVA